MELLLRADHSHKSLVGAKIAHTHLSCRAQHDGWPRAQWSRWADGPWLAGSLTCDPPGDLNLATVVRAGMVAAADHRRLHCEEEVLPVGLWGLAGRD